MLQRATVSPATLLLLKGLMQIDRLQDYYLVGGTALALQYGHRISIDLDFFVDEGFDPDEISTVLPIDYQEFGRTRIFFGANVQGIKCDFVKNLFPRKLPLIVEEGIRMAKPLEIAAMKLWAITRRGAKKDFWDLYFLLREFSLEEMFIFFKTKYPNIEPMMVSKSLAYFTDAENDLDPVTVIPLTWEEVKTEVSNHLRAFERKR